MEGRGGVESRELGGGFDPNKVHSSMKENIKAEWVTEDLWLACSR